MNVVAAATLSVSVQCCGNQSTFEILKNCGNTLPGTYTVRVYIKLSYDCGLSVKMAKITTLQVGLSTNI